MDVPVTHQRRLWGDYFCGMKHRDESPEKFMKRIHGARVIERMETPRSQGCYWFVFKDEEWFKKMGNRDILTSPDALDFLRTKGYKEVETPEDGDVIIYLFSASGRVVHYGRYSKEKVVSKFGKRNVYEHDISSVPDMFGDEAVVLRKR